MGKRKVVGTRVTWTPIVKEEPDNPWPGIFGLLVLILIMAVACGG